MPDARKIILSVLLGCACAAAAAVPVDAEEPATVTVRIEGSTETLLPATVVTTTGAPVVKDGTHSCDGYDAIGALDLATHSDWSGQWFDGEGYTVETLLGESHPLSSNPYWGIWFDDAYAKKGVCQQTLRTGDTLLFAPAETPAPSPLGIEVPSTATIGVPVTVAVVSYSDANGEPSPAAGATVVYEGRTVTTDSTGRATIQFAQSGQQSLRATKEHFVRTEATICVNAPGRSGCAPPSGTAPGGVPTSGAGEVAGFSTGARPNGAVRLVTTLTSPRSGRTYRHGHGPRLIAGRISPASSVSSVSLMLRRSDGHRCYAYDAARGRFRRARCGTAQPFRVSQSASFSYLLPGRLTAGRYVLTVEASEAGASTHHNSVVVFYVR